MNHDAKYSGGIFRKRPVTPSTSTGRMTSLQSSRNGSLSCPSSPRKHLPALPVTLSDMSFHDVHTMSSSFRDGPRIHRSPSANTYNGYSSRQYGQFSYTGQRQRDDIVSCSAQFFIPKCHFHVSLTGSPSAPTSANTSRVDLRNLGRPSTGSVLYLGRTSSLSGSRLSLVSRASSLSSPHSSPKHRSRQ